MTDTGAQPGQTVTPTQPAPANVPQQTPAPPAKAPEPPQPANPAPAAEEEKQLFNSEQLDAQQPDAANGEELPAVTWTASEFIAHAKSFGWYTGLAAVAVAIAAVVFLITRDALSVGVVILGAVLLGIYGAHKPRQLEYRLDNHGLNIGQKHFGYHQFRSFSIISEDAFESIVFMPLKRFAAPTTIYFAPEDEDKIVKLLSGCLPFEEGVQDPIDRLMQRIRF